MKIYQSIIAFLLILSVASCNRKMKVPVADPNNGGLFLPDQFEAFVVVDSIGSARHIAVNDNGDIYVKLQYNEKKNGSEGTVGLRDLDGDGKADSIAYFGDYKDIGSSAVGMTIHNGYLYTSTVNQVLRTKLTPGKLIPEEKTEVMLTDLDSNVARNWHTTKPVAFDKKGNMYVPFGTPTDAGQDITKYGPVGMPGGVGLDPPPDLENHGGIWRFDASKTNQFQKDGVRISTGIRSIVGMQWNNQDDHLYAVVNGIDNLHTIYPTLFNSWQAAVLPAELLIRADEGTNFGWPYAYYDQMQKKNVLQPGYGGDGKIIGRASAFTEPVIGFPGHWAPMDVMFYEGNQFPDRYKNGAFVAFHGSTDRSPYPQAGYIVCFVPFSNGKATGDIELFADGFTGIDTVVNTSDAKYRPMGLSTGPDGSLYITESNQGKIWRIMYKGDKKTFGPAQLTAMEKRKSRTYIKTPDPKLDNLQTGDALEGSILYETYCSRCHSRNGMGDKSRFPPLLESPYVMGDKNLLISIILNGLQGSLKVGDKTYNSIMPAHKNILDDHAIASISTYIRRRFGKRASAVKTTDVKALRSPNSTPKTLLKDNRMVSVFTSILQLITVVCLYSPAKEFPVYEGDTALIHKTSDFTITGKGDNAAWEKASWQLFTKIDSGGKNYNSKSKMLYSDKGLYLLFTGEDERITTKDYKDDEEIYEGDVFEFFLRPDTAKPSYFEYEINQLGKQLVLVLSGISPGNLAWSPWAHEYNENPLIQRKIIVSNRINNKETGVKTIKPGASIAAWSAELFFPYELFGLLHGLPPKSGMVCRANFCRIDYDSGKMIQWTWSRKIKSSFHELKNLGFIQFE